MRDRRRHQQRIADRAELHLPHAIAVGVDHFGRHLQREPGLADPARSHERQQALTRQQPLDLHYLAFAADERRQRLGQIRSLAAHGTLSRLGRDLDDRPDEPIASPRQRLDPTLASGRLRKHATDRRNLHGEIAFFNDDARPRGIHDRALLNKLVAPLDERG